MRVSIQRKYSKTQKLLQNIRRLERDGVYIGIPSERNARKDGADMNNAEIGYINEKGSAANNIPARPFLVPSIEEAQTQISEILKPDMQDVKPTVALKKAGTFAADRVRLFIRAQKGFKPLSPVTIAIRKSKRKNGQAGNKALIDTGSLIRSITYVVDKG